jgi:hypothetical protein
MAFPQMTERQQNAFASPGATVDPEFVDSPY